MNTNKYFSYLVNVIEILDDDEIFVSTTTPEIVDLCNSPLSLQTDNHTRLRNTRSTAGTTPIVRRMAEQFEMTSSRTACMRTAKRPVGIANSSPPSMRHRIEKPKTTDNGIKPINCAVCLEHPNDRKPTSTICGHIFCEICIKMAINQHKKCPLCQRKLSLKSIHPIYL